MSQETESRVNTLGDWPKTLRLPLIRYIKHLPSYETGISILEEGRLRSNRLPSIVPIEKKNSYGKKEKVTVEYTGPRNLDKGIRLN